MQISFGKAIIIKTGDSEVLASQPTKSSNLKSRYLIFGESDCDIFFKGRASDGINEVAKPGHVELNFQKPRRFFRKDAYEWRRRLGSFVPKGTSIKEVDHNRSSALMQRIIKYMRLRRKIGRRTLLVR